MESFSGETEESTEDLPGRKKSKLRFLKTRLFGKSKKAGEENTKLSQSASDITAAEGLGSDEDLACSQGMMGSRALSHDSIFLAGQDLTDDEPVRDSSQQNVHSKIKALQTKLLQQKLHFGPPPAVLPVKRPEDLSCHSEESLDHSPPDSPGGDVTSYGALTKTTSQPASCPFSPIPRSVPTKSLPPTPSHFSPFLGPTTSSSAVEAPLDFSAPAQFTPCLDTSAARHRMAVKPKNQRASMKKKLTVTQSLSLSHTLNNVDNLEPLKEPEQQLGVQEEVTVEADQPDTSQHLPCKEVAPVPSEVTPVPSKVAPAKSEVASVPLGVAPVMSEVAPKSPSLSFPQRDQALPWTAPSVLRVKPYRRVDAASSKRPHSSYIESELKEKREVDFGIQLMSHDKRSTLNKTGMAEGTPDQPSSPFSSMAAFRSSSARQHAQVEGDSTRGIRRPAPGSGSFHLTITTARNRDGERPRSGSFTEVLEQTEAKNKQIGGTEDKENRGLQPRGGPFDVGKLRQEVPRSPVISWDKRDSLKKVEPSKSVPADTGVVVGQEVESSQDEVEQAVEAKEVLEEEGKMAFGVKLRSTSQSIRLRPNADHDSKTLLCEDQSEKQTQQEVRASYMSEKLPANTTFIPTNLGEPRPRDPTPSGLSPPVKHSALFTIDPPITPAEFQMTAAEPKEAETAPQEPQPAPQTAASEVSWMSLAMEKTRSLQQLFTSRFPRDFTGMQTTARPQAQAQPTNQTETVTGTPIQTVKIQQSATHLEAVNQPSADTVKAEAVLSRSQAQTVKSPPVTVQQKVSVMTSVTSKEPPKQPNQDQSSATQFHPAVPWITPSPVHVPSQTDATSQFAQGATQSLAQSYLSSGQQQPPWSNRGPATQLKSTAVTLTPVVSSPAAPPSVPTLGREEEEATGKIEGPSLSVRRAVWSGSVSDRAMFLEKRAEWTTLPGPKGVELRKPQTDVQTSGEPPVLVKIASLSKDAMPEERQGVNFAESSPTKVLERPLEDKWPRKNVVASSLRSSPPTLPSGLQSVSDSGQPSWMELAKRKSMAWSDKTMD